MLEPGQGNEKAFQSVKDAPKNTERGIRQAWFAVGRRHINRLSRDMLARDKTGRVYVRRDRSGRRRRHQASAPGETAANRSGRMRRNRGFQLSGSDQLEFGIRDTPYAAFLERGTRRMRPRPSLGNTVRAEEKNTELELERSIKARLTR